MPPKRRPLADRFWAKVARVGGDGCWEWTGARSPKGYGVFQLGRGEGARRANRVAWEMANGPIAECMQVLHRCDNPPCVRPEHLFLGSNGENHKDKVQKGRQARGDRAATRLHPEIVRRGTAATNAKLTDAQVVQMRAEYAAGGISIERLGERFGVSYYAAWKVLRGVGWKHVP